MQFKHDALKMKRRKERDAPRRARMRGDVEGCHQVTIGQAGQAVEVTGLERAFLIMISDPDSVAAEAAQASRVGAALRGISSTMSKWPETSQ